MDLFRFLSHLNLNLATVLCMDFLAVDQSVVVRSLNFQLAVVVVLVLMLPLLLYSVASPAYRRPVELEVVDVLTILTLEWIAVLAGAVQFEVLPPSAPTTPMLTKKQKDDVRWFDDETALFQLELLVDVADAN